MGQCSSSEAASFRTRKSVHLMVQSPSRRHSTTVPSKSSVLSPFRERGVVPTSPNDDKFFTYNETSLSRQRLRQQLDGSDFVSPQRQQVADSSMVPSAAAARDASPSPAREFKSDNNDGHVANLVKFFESSSSSSSSGINSKKQQQPRDEALVKATSPQRAARSASPSPSSSKNKKMTSTITAVEFDISDFSSVSNSKKKHEALCKALAPHKGEKSTVKLIFTNKFNKAEIDFGHVAPKSSAQWANKYAKAITSVAFAPECSSVRKISNCFLKFAENVTDIDFSPLYQVESIGDDFLYGCSSLQSINLMPFATSVKRVGSYFCSGCISMSSVESLNVFVASYSKLEKIGDWFCSSCTAVESVDFSDKTNNCADSTLNAVGRGFFYNCTSLKSVSGLELIASSVKSVGSDCFKECTSLDSESKSQVKNFCSSKQTTMKKVR